MTCCHAFSRRAYIALLLNQAQALILALKLPFELGRPGRARDSNRGDVGKPEGIAGVLQLPEPGLVDPATPCDVSLVPERGFGGGEGDAAGLVRCQAYGSSVWDWRIGI